MGNGSGDTLMAILRRQGIDRVEADRAIQAARSLFNLRRLKIGQEITLVTGTDETGADTLRTVVLRVGEHQGQDQRMQDADAESDAAGQALGHVRDGDRLSAAARSRPEEPAHGRGRRQFGRPRRGGVRDGRAWGGGFGSGAEGAMKAVKLETIRGRGEPTGHCPCNAPLRSGARVAENPVIR